MSGIETDDKCPRCGAPVRWRLSIEGTRLRLDAAPDPTGNVIVIQIAGTIRAKVLCGPEMPAQQEAFRQHQCPSSGRPGPLCAVCKRPMHRELAQLLLWTDHPGCCAAYRAEVARIRAGLRKAS